MGSSVHEHKESQQQQPGVSDCTGAVLYLCSGSSIKIMKSVPQHEVAAAGNGVMCRFLLDGSGFGWLVQLCHSTG